MEVFVRVVDLGGFTAAAREFRLTPSGVSKLVSRLEARLGSRLVNRSTRRLQLTPEGQAFYLRSARILASGSPGMRTASWLFLNWDTCAEEPRRRRNSPSSRSIR